MVGTIAAYRQEVRPFSDKQIALLQNFAAQAVIAMENARLFTETREASGAADRDRRSTKVINSSPGDLAPVFDAMLEKALRLCEADLGTRTYDGDSLRNAASLRALRRIGEILRRSGDTNPGRARSMRRARLSWRAIFIHIADLADDTEAYRSGEPTRRQGVDAAGARSVWRCRCAEQAILLGLINIYRQEVSAVSPTSRSPCCRISPLRR